MPKHGRVFNHQRVQEASGVTGGEVKTLEDAAMGQVLLVLAFGEGTWPLHKNTSDHAKKTCYRHYNRCFTK
jgi:hypothetical protein